MKLSYKNNQAADHPQNCKGFRETSQKANLTPNAKHLFIYQTYRILKGINIII